ncbi:hypothetical protein FOA52_002502 [Chlamydomonas sp. UWO 241]|nr:hypothetical protein FOA52_002502 [Chlamydomonas sp. UWO 241]
MACALHETVFDERIAPCDAGLLSQPDAGEQLLDADALDSYLFGDSMDSTWWRNDGCYSEDALLLPLSDLGWSGPEEPQAVAACIAGCLPRPAASTGGSLAASDDASATDTLCGFGLLAPPLMPGATGVAFLDTDDADEGGEDSSNSHASAGPSAWQALRPQPSLRASGSLASMQSCDGDGFQGAACAVSDSIDGYCRSASLPSASSLDCFSAACSPRHGVSGTADALAAPSDAAAGTGCAERRSSRARRAASSYAPYHLGSPRGKKGRGTGAACKLSPHPEGHACTACAATATPVWRAGPGGPKTLCNACGVRWMKHRDAPPAKR